MWDGLSSSHISGGHWNQALTSNERHRAVPRRGHGAQFLTQHRHAGPSANSGSVDTVPEPSGCTPLSLSSCDHRQAAFSAAGCECSLPEMKTCNFFAQESDGAHRTKQERQCSMKRTKVRKKRLPTQPGPTTGAAWEEVGTRLVWLGCSDLPHWLG